MWQICTNSITQSDGQIRWSHLCDLDDIQESAALRAANKLSKKHIQFQKNDPERYLQNDIYMGTPYIPTTTHTLIIISYWVYKLGCHYVCC